MIKVKFKTPQYVVSDCLVSKAMFVYTNEPLLPNNICLVAYENGLPISTFSISDIQSIEHVKPTEL